jgi:hypothetical protein
MSKTTKCISQVGSGRYLDVEVECKAGETVANLGDGGDKDKGSIEYGFSGEFWMTLESIF